jgi:DNA-directed RNA polymerase subunit RPC12/RpoP
MMNWIFKCWSCGFAKVGRYHELPKTQCPKCGAGRMFAGIKRTEEPKPKPKS